METARYLVGGGHGVGFFTRALVSDDLRRGVLKEVAVKDMPPVTRDSALVRRIRAAPMSAASSQLVACIRAEAEHHGLRQCA